MSPVWKGALLGAINVYVVAFLAAVMQVAFESGETYVITSIAVLGFGPGLAVGALAGALARRLRVCRRLALAGLAMTGVALLGLYTHSPLLIWLATPSTVICALVLEHWTRLDAARASPSPPSPVWVGIGVGAINAIAIAVAFRIHLDGDDRSIHRYLGDDGFAFFVGCLGLIPGFGVGAALGKFAGTLADYRPMMRALLIGTLALGGMVTTLGVALVPLEIDLVSRGLLLPALVPTVLCSLLLERLTRPVDPVPRARAIV